MGNSGVAALAWLWAASTALEDEPMKTTAAVDVAPRSEDVREQLVPRASFDGEETFLVVWQQGNDYYETESADILAARISSSGRVLDERPIGVCTAPNSQMNPVVAFSDGVFLVVWMDLRN